MSRLHRISLLVGHRQVQYHRSHLETTRSAMESVVDSSFLPAIDVSLILEATPTFGSTTLNFGRREGANISYSVLNRQST